jgi:sec-independent protein translocase protein TatA
MTLPGGWELILIVFLIVLLFGAKKLPGLARSVGESMTEFRKGTREGAEAAEDEPEGDGPKAKTDREREKER